MERGLVSGEGAGKVERALFGLGSVLVCIIIFENLA